MNHRFGWRRSIPDHRDLFLAAPSPTIALPAAVDLRPSFHQRPYDQGNLGSCTAQAICGVVQYAEEKASGKTTGLKPSRLLLYYSERELEGTTDYDSGAEGRDGFKVIASQGMCAERYWPYHIEAFAQRPPDRCYRLAVKHKAVKYQRVPQNLLDIRACLASGWPFAFGFTCYESLETPEVDDTGNVPMPGPDEGIVGGHFVVGVGYDDGLKIVRFRNSWGTWGDHGYGTIPYAYLTNPNLSDDFWQVQVVT